MDILGKSVTEHHGIHDACFPAYLFILERLLKVVEFCLKGNLDGRLDPNHTFHGFIVELVGGVIGDTIHWDIITPFASQITKSRNTSTERRLAFIKVNVHVHARGTKFKFNVLEFFMEYSVMNFMLENFINSVVHVLLAIAECGLLSAKRIITQELNFVPPNLNIGELLKGNQIPHHVQTGLLRHTRKVPIVTLLVMPLLTFSTLSTIRLMALICRRHPCSDKLDLVGLRCTPKMF